MLIMLFTVRGLLGEKSVCNVHVAGRQDSTFYPMLDFWRRNVSVQWNRNLTLGNYELEEWESTQTRFILHLSGVNNQTPSAGVT